MLPRERLDRIEIAFDDHRLVANAGLILPVTLAHRLGPGELVDCHVDLGDAPGRANAGDKLLTLVASALAGRDCIDDADALGAGESLSRGIVAPAATRWLTGGTRSIGRSATAATALSAGTATSFHLWCIHYRYLLQSQLGTRHSHANNLRYSTCPNRPLARYRSHRTLTKRLPGPPYCGGAFGVCAVAESRHWLQSRRR